MTRSIEFIYADSTKRGHVLDKDGNPVCNNRVRASMGGSYRATRETQAPDEWCKVCERMTTFPWETEE